MRIIAGAWRGRGLGGPVGAVTRPTADRVRQALFDMLVHAPWAEPGWLDGISVLDGFAGTGALGLEALSRGAAEAVFIERDRAALAVLRANIATCGAEAMCRVVAGDVLRPPPGGARGLVFLDPPYGEGFVPKAVASLRAAGWIDSRTVIVSELGRFDFVDNSTPILAQRAHGAAQLVIWRGA